MRTVKLLVVSLIGLLAAVRYAAADELTSVPPTCPITKPSKSPFIPPAPHEPHPSGRFWHGTPALWTILPNDGMWRGIKSSTGTRNKFVWWRKDWKWDDDLGANGPGLMVAARRLDAKAPEIHIRGATNAKINTGWSMLVGLELPTSGCWEITGNYRSDYLAMVVWVPD